MTPDLMVGRFAVYLTDFFDTVQRALVLWQLFFVKVTYTMQIILRLVSR